MPNHRVAIAYEVAAADGDVAERGWENEVGQSVEPDPIRSAVRLLQDAGATEPSSTRWSPGVWYRTPDADIDMHTGEHRYTSYFLRGFTNAEQRHVYQRMNPNPRADLEIFERVPGFYFYARDAEPFASSPEGRTERYLVGPFKTKQDAADY